MSSADENKIPSNSPSYFETLLDAVPTGIIVTYQNGSIRYLNAEAERLFGYHRNELINQSIDVLLPERFAQIHVQHRQTFIDSPSTRYMGAGRDLFGRRKNGSEFPLEIGLRPLESNGEKFVAATIVDITTRKQLEERFEKVIEASPYGQLLIDEKGVIQLINRSLLELFGYKSEELLYQNMDILLPERYRDNHAVLRNTYIQTPSLRAMGAGRDLTGRHKNGTEIPIEIGLSPVETDKGRLTLAVVTDISERKRLVLSLQQANAHLEEFTYVASHDLKSPLRGIADLIEWIAEDLGTTISPSTSNNIGRVKIRINRMERLIDDLLMYARAGKREKESTLVDIATLCNGIIEMHLVPENFKIIQSISIKEIQAAKTPLEIVLRNLFSNALKHHDGLNPCIEISAEPSGSYCLFQIKDNGPGIPAAAHDRVFRLFQTLSNSETSSGIGLALAKRLTESHGGQIELVANEGVRGCIFRVWWPRFSRKDIDE
jgi:PAS domain S-box-containing protein